MLMLIFMLMMTKGYNPRCRPPGSDPAGGLCLHWRACCQRGQCAGHLWNHHHRHHLDINNFDQLCLIWKANDNLQVM